MYKIIIASDFSSTPGARYRSDGRWSGEEFRDVLLRPRFNKAVEEEVKLWVDLDGVEGYATSFLEESFGGLAREYGSKKVLDRIEFKSDDEPYLIEDIISYIETAQG